MGAIIGEELMKLEKMQGMASGGEEKILVLVRLRPLSEKEIARNEVADWECINDTTILCRNSLLERPGLPTAYAFDRVFRGDCSTKQVYEEATKEIALSVVSGINSSIFAYGQTSSGKTYTMNGITEYTVADIYDCIERHEERTFVLKFSAIEIYNEVVKDLLSTESTQLRLLDDPEKGTIVEKLTEKTLRDRSHLKELLSICEAQRQTVETYLNETSSRSHQILRLTIESSAREFVGKDKLTTLAASVNFVDLAGSERASQALSVGQRLKEGCHINRSLLTLGTVIRKLSNGRQGHVNYRDSKLTRILQPALGGNARTAIICTLSPARSYVEQSRNTLFFASCAKEVTTNAQVNIVMSDKALVKYLQKEVARLESELRTQGSTCDYTSLLRQKDLQIEKLEKEVRELTKQRDLAQSRVEDLLRVVGNEHFSRQGDVLNENAKLQGNSTCEDECSVSEASDGTDPHYVDVGARKINATQSFDVSPKADYLTNATQSSNGDNRNNGPPYLRSPEDERDHSVSDSTSSPLSNRSKSALSDRCQGMDEFALKTGEDSDGICKEVQCIEMDDCRKGQTCESFALSNGENEGPPLTVSDNVHMAVQELVSSPLRVVSHIQNDFTYTVLEQKIQDVQKVVNSLASPFPDEPSPWSLGVDMSSSRRLKLTRSHSCRANLMAGSLSSDSETVEESERTPPNGFERQFPGRPEGHQRKHWKLLPLNYDTYTSRLSRNDSQSSIGSAFINDPKAHHQAAGNEDIPSIGTFVAGLKEMAKLQYETLLDDQVPEREPKAEKSRMDVKDVGLDPMQDTLGDSSDWPLEFERLQKLILELWQTCNVSLVHRTYFFLLFKGDPMDSIYMEVEHRRLSFLKETFSKGNLTVQDGRNLTLASSMKALRHEREMLSRLLNKMFSKEDRKRMYQKWGISLDSKRRRLQLVQRLWGDTKDMNRITESAAIVAQLIRFSEQGQAPKEMFGLSFTPPHMSRRSFSWKRSMVSLL
ncbi:unnamed protein product [Ilex paraguariensis]|uniref:Kinesin-like protein n=1 Tax=Ilex paraguariensis TaxID=185542 RepID=A0ABC8SY51_9AQUA